MLQAKGRVTKESSQVKIDVDGFEYIADMSVEEGGKGEGTSPGGLLLSALSGCNAIVARMYLEKHGIDYSYVDVTVDGDFDQSAASVDLTANVNVVTDADLDDEGVERLGEYVKKVCPITQIVKTEQVVNEYFSVE